MEELNVPGLPSHSGPPSAPAGKTSVGQRIVFRLRHGSHLYRVVLRALHRTVYSVAAHDCLNVAQSTAYSAIVALFPTLIIAAAVIGMLPDTAPLRVQLIAFFDRIMPPTVSTLVDAVLQNTPKHAHSLRALVSAAFVSIAGASNVIATLMEGFRRSRELPDVWSFWERRRVALKLVPISLAPLFLASLLVVFGHAVAGWLAYLLPEVQTPIYVATLLIRWVLALGVSVGVIALLYHNGIPDLPSRKGRDKRSIGRTARAQLLRLRAEVFAGLPALRRTLSWRSALPGAVMATAMWFATTLVFGWYVTRLANYSEVYGSLGAAIALLFWLYIVSLSVLCGAEFNAQFESQYQEHFGAAASVASVPQSRQSEQDS